MQAKQKGCETAANKVRPDFTALVFLITLTMHPRASVRNQ